MAENDRVEVKDEGKEKSRLPPGSLWRVLKYADWKDKVLMILGLIGCFANGLGMALIQIVMSNLMNSYASSFSRQDMNKFALDFIYLAVGVGSGAFLEGFCWARTAERQTSRLRTMYLKAVLRQDVGFFDTSEDKSITSQVVSTISNDMLKIQGVFSEKLPNFLTNMSLFIAPQLAALYLSWRLAVVVVPGLFLLIIPMMVYGKLLMKNGMEIYKAYAVAEGIVEQAVSSIRTVYSYVGEERMMKSYSNALQQTMQLGIKQGLLKGMAIGSIGVTFALWAFQAWYGSVLVIQKGDKGGNVFTAGACIVFGGLALGSALNNVRFITEANVAASRIFELIHRVPSIDSENQQGEIIADVKGELQFNNIDFAYPSRPDSLVLKKFNLKVMAYQTVALVGKSGSGKSTVINLLERFYAPLRGVILLDGVDIKELQLKWLRSQMGLVSQEPILFATTIKDNIQFGKENASMEEIIRAAEAANAHNFIEQLPKKYDTLVGQLGIQMSGGQKQRISIARALLRDPKILLLDEATSSLDSHSEKAVQDALNQASIGRTTIIIAHRLSSLRTADLITVINSGEVVESGSHEELLQNINGAYSTMVQQQKTLTDDEVTVSLVKETECRNDNEPISEGSFENKESVKKPEDPHDPPNLKQLMLMATPEWKSTLLGCIGAISNGLIQPFHTFCMGSLLSVYFLNDKNEIRSETRKYCFIFLSFAALSCITNVIQHYNFGHMGESLTKRVREDVFGKILTFEMEWFDEENNNSGAICSRLATDATMVRTLIADRLSLLAQSISSTTLAAVLTLVLSWRLAIVALAVQPLVICAYYGVAVIIKRMSKKILKAQNKASELASEAVGNHRIITAFYSQDKILKLFELTQIIPEKESHRQSWYAGFALYFSQFITSANTALLLWYGGKLLYQGNILYKNIFQIFFILMSTSKVIADAGSTTSDLSKGSSALESIFMILKRKSKMDPDDLQGIKPEKIEGDIEFKEVDFFYPARPKQIVLSNVNLKIDAGRVAAIVGESGSGKSTIIRLIERFYDPSKGCIQIDGVDIKCYNLKALRSHIALVSQEPTLFAGTIKDNISYGRENATEAEITEAATIANAHDFISSMKDGYGTYCGERGMQISGGQKQRIAIARAVLKNPLILLLDEATSALDNNSENLVRDALEKTMAGRTCMVVAHKLSTVEKSDKICVIENGRVVEQGSHGELLGKGEKGAYFSLVKCQQIGFDYHKMR